MKRTIEASPTFTHLDYIAYRLYSREIVRTGVPPVRWWCSSAEHREKWRALAEQRIRKWQETEEWATTADPTPPDWVTEAARSMEALLEIPTDAIYPDEAARSALREQAKKRAPLTWAPLAEEDS